MNARSIFLALSFALVTTAGCSSGGLGTSSDGGHKDAATFDAAKPARVPLNHRPSDAQCATTPGPGSCNGQTSDPGMCTSDATCTAGTNGRCAELMGGVIDCQCTYDTCQQDTDCPSNQVCACHGSPLLAVGNTCFPGNCRIDSDCGTNGYCSPSAGMQGCGGLAGYYCHTTQDTCIDDSDCADGTNTVCEYSVDHWSCQEALFCA